MTRAIAAFLLGVALLTPLPAGAGVASELHDWYLLPAVASAPGQLGTYFRTDVTLVNPYVAHSVTIQIWLLKNDQDNSQAQSVTLTLAPGETIVLRDIVSSTFNYSGGASLILSSADGFAFACNARTYTGTASTYGFGGNAHHWDNVGQAEAFVSGLRNGGGYRTNMGLASTSSIPITVEVNVYNSTSKLGTRRVTLPPYGRTQFAVSDIAPSFDNAYAVWTGITSSSDARWVPFATVIDNASGDSIYIDDIYDGAYSTYESHFDLTGEWRGTAAWSTGSQTLTALVYQYGPRIEAWIYDSNTGARVTYLTGYENKGDVFGEGTGSLLQCLSDPVSVSGTVVSNGSALSLTQQGSGCFASVASIYFQKYRTFSAPPASSGSIVAPVPLSTRSSAEPPASRTKH